MGKLERDEYDVPAIIDMTLFDLSELVKFLRETRKFKPEKDDKLINLSVCLKLKNFWKKSNYFY